MKYLLIFSLISFSFKLYSAELSGVELITPVRYTLTPSFGDTTLSQVTAGAANVFNVDIEKKVQEKISPFKKDLASYFSTSAELESYISNSIKMGKKLHLSSVTDKNLIKFYGFLGTNLIAGIADKILEKEGVTNPLRRKLWVDKMTEPFNSCITLSKNSQYDASHCIDALSASLVPSTGIAIVYELSKANLNSALPEIEQTPFNFEQSNFYKSCIKSTKMAASDVKLCALSSMKNGVLRVTEPNLTETLKSKSSHPKKADEIKKIVWPIFDNCVQNVGSNPNDKLTFTQQFSTCLDKMIIQSGSLLVEDKIINTKTISNTLDPSTVSKLSTSKKFQFQKCAEDTMLKNLRKDGLLDISTCENIITNEVTYLVVLETLNKSASSTAKDNKSIALKLSTEGKKLLDSCWSKNQTDELRETCLRKTITAFSKSAATSKLSLVIPTQMPSRDKIMNTSVTDFGQCIENSLPKNISESDDLTKRLDNCTAKLTKSVALKVAEFQIKDTAKDNLTTSQSDELVKRLVLQDFTKCIGEFPNDSILEKCSDALVIEAAQAIAQISFKKEVYGYLIKAGGLQSLNLSESKVDQFIQDLNLSNNQCLNGKKKDPVMDHVNFCLKKSIKNIALFFGEVQFNNSVGNMYEGKEAEKKTIEFQFKTNLDSCLSQKDGNEYSISDYTAHLYICADKVALATTNTVGIGQVDSALNQYLADRPGIDYSQERAELKNTILGHFSTCMSQNSKDSSKCIDELKKEATLSIVLNYGRLETKTQLNTDNQVPQLLPVEEVFKKCTETKLTSKELSEQLDLCTIEYALQFAKELGELKLNYLLKQTLGTNDFNAQKSDINSAILKYNSCLKDLRKYSLKDGLTSKLGICTDQLTQNGMDIVRKNINIWMTSEEKEMAINSVKQGFSFMLPCLSALLPASPYNQNLQENIESSIKPLAVLISHYIEYNPENAKQTLEGIIRALSTDLNDVAKSDVVKKELVEYLYSSGALDQFIKGIVRGTVKDAFLGLSEKDIPLEMRQLLLKKEIYEEIFNSPEGQKIKILAMEKILKPALLDKVDLSGPVFKASVSAIKDNVIKLLIDAPSFGEAAIKLGVQKQINEMNGVVKFFAKALYGGDSLNWEKLRASSEGKIAEAYIKENVLMPKFKGITLSETEINRINIEAEKLVKKAATNYR